MIDGISPHVYGHTRGADVHPQSPQQLARPKEFGECVQFSETVVDRTTLVLLRDSMSTIEPKPSFDVVLSSA